MYVVKNGAAVQRRKLPRQTEKALFVREIVQGRPAVGRIAEAVGVSVAYTYAALRLTPEECAQVRLGLWPLWPRAPRIPATPAPAQERLAQIVTEIGADAVLDYLAANETAVAVTHVDSVPEEGSPPVSQTASASPGEGDEVADWWRELRGAA